MGPAIARAFAREGCRLVMAGRDMAAIEALAGRLRAEAIVVVTVACDVTQADDCFAMATRATEGRTTSSVDARDDPR